MRAALYLRVSTQEQATSGLSLDHQEDVTRTAALKAGASSLEVFTDAGFSGTTLRRPALTALRTRLSEFCCVYVYKLDRWCRNISGFARLMEELAEAKVGFVSVSEGIDYSSSHGRLTMNMLASVAAYFADLNKERVRDVIRHRTETLGLPHGKPPYGYAPPAEKRQPWVVVPEEAQVVRKIFQRFAGGESLHVIARALNTADYPRKQDGQQWWVSSLHKMLANPAYVGEYRFRGNVYRGQHEPLVSERTWAKVQARLRLHKNWAVRGTFTLSPLFRCGECKGPVGQGNRVPRFFCTRRPQLGDTAHPPISVAARKAEAALWAYTQSLLTQETLTRAIDDYRHSQAALTDRARDAEIARRLREIDRLLAVNLRALQIGAITEGVLQAENAPLLAEQELLLHERQGLAPKKDYSATAAYLRQLNPESTIRRMAQAPTDTKLAFLTRLYEKVEIWQDRLVVYHRAPVPSMTITLPAFYFPQAKAPARFILASGDILFWQP